MFFLVGIFVLGRKTKSFCSEKIYGQVSPLKKRGNRFMPYIEVINLQKGPKWEDVEKQVQNAAASIEGLNITPEGVTVYPFDPSVPCLHLPVQVKIRVLSMPHRTADLLEKLNDAVKLAVIEIANRRVVSVWYETDEKHLNYR